MVSFVAHFQSTSLLEVLKMPSVQILKWYNESVKLYNKINKTD